MILDSGERREFQSGAVRDVAEGKGRMDLVPFNEEIPFSCTQEEIEGDHIVNWEDGAID